MSKFKKKSKASQEIPTAALPDIIFMLLFFFMVTTVMRDSELLVENKMPKATQLRKIKRKSWVSYVYIGKPKIAEKFGKEPRIQVNDNFADLSEIVPFIYKEKDKLKEEANFITMSLKVDQDTEMGIISDVEEEFKEANALRVLYNTPLDVDK